MGRPWMPLYVATYLANTAHLTAAEHGAYLLLIMHYWEMGGLPADETRIARIARMSPEEWERSGPIIKEFFNENWKHERIEEELAHAEEVSGKRRAAAERRHHKSNANANANEDANAEQLDTHARVTVLSSSPTSSELEDTQVERPSGRECKTPLPENFVPDRRVPDELGWPEERYEREVKKFCEDAAAHGRRYVKWQMAWAKWCRSPYQRDGPNGHVVVPEMSRKERIRNENDRALAKLKDFIERSNDGSAGGDVCEPFGGLLSGPGHRQS